MGFAALHPSLGAGSLGGQQSLQRWDAMMHLGITFSQRTVSFFEVEFAIRYFANELAIARQCFGYFVPPKLGFPASVQDELNSLFALVVRQLDIGWREGRCIGGRVLAFVVRPATHVET